MTAVRITKNGNKYRITVRGHADDLKVCTACSTLTCTLINAILEEETAGRALRVGLRENLDSPEIIVEFEPIPGQEERILGIAEVIRIGYAALAEHYPNHVSLETRGLSAAESGRPEICDYWNIGK